VLSPTTYLIPLSIQALIASPLCKPVMAGGTRPKGENLAAPAMVVFFSQSLLNMISRFASWYVALLSGSWVNVCDKCANASRFVGVANHVAKGSSLAQAWDQV
jgi:hypothetical protein